VLTSLPRSDVFDGYAGWDPKYRIKVRVIASRAYHALFMVSSPSCLKLQTRS
jgi:ATP-dependent phosphoenolpyruvate carboxykinase